MQLYGLKNCDSCKKALSQLCAAGYGIDFFDIRTDPLDQSQIVGLVARFGDHFVRGERSRDQTLTMFSLHFHVFHAFWVK